MTKKRKIALVSIAICLVLCVAIGSSFAIWKVTNKQTTANNFQSCFQLNYVEESEAIALDNTFPMTDTDGLKETPFTFTLTNVCENEVYYQINLETLLEPTAATTLQDGDLKVAINKKDYTTNSPKVLSDYDRVTTTGLVENAKRAYKLETGALPAHGEITYNVWEYINDTSKSSDVTNKEHKSKISIIYTSDEEDRNTYLYNAPETCFNFDVASGEIVGYYSHEENDPSKDACPMNVVVPSTIDGHTVTKLGGYLFNGLGFTAIEIPNTITSIGDYALAHNNIKDIVIPDSVTSIGVYSFINSGIENLKLSNGLINIPLCAFSDNRIKKLEIPSNIKTISDWAFSNNRLTNIIFNEGLESIGTVAFVSNNITTLSLPTSLKVVGYGSFNNNKLSDDQAFIYKRNSDGSTDNTILVSYGGAKKDDIIVPSQVKELDIYAFLYAAINSISLNNGLQTIKYGAFDSNNLTTISIPNTVTSIAPLAFTHNKLQASDAIIYGRNSDGTPNTTIVSYGGTGGAVTIPEGTTMIGQSAFLGAGLTSLTLPSTLTYIDDGAFNNNQLPDDQAFIYNRNIDGSVDYSKIVSYGGATKNNINIPSSVNGVNLTSIGTRAFESCGLVGSVVIPNTVTAINTQAFSMNSISSVVIPDSVVSIDRSAFLQNAITSLSLGNNIQTIGDYAFNNNLLSSVTIPTSVTSIGSNSFSTNPLTEVKIKGKNSPSDFTSYGTNVFGWRAGYSDASIEWNAS